MRICKQSNYLFAVLGLFVGFSAYGTEANAAPSANNSNFTVTSPASGVQVSGIINIIGNAGSEWVNTRAYVGGQPVTLDVAPNNGTFTLSLNTAQLPNGNATIAIDAFSVPAGNPGNVVYQKDEIDLNLTINNAAPAPTPTPSPAPAETLSIKSATPTLSVPGSAITIVGTGFGATQGTGTAYMFIDEMTVVSWSDTKIVAIVPSQLTVGAQYNIVVKNSSGASQAFSGVTIVAATPSPTPAPAPAPTSTPTPAPTPTPSPAPAPTPTPSPAPAETLSIKSATPTLSVPGSAITIVGTGFGATQGTGTAYMFIDEMTVVSWSDTKIVAIVPSQLTVGAQYNIVVKNSSGASQAFSGVTIVAATPSPTPAPAPAPTSTPTPAPTPTPSPAPAPTPTPSPAPAETLSIKSATPTLSVPGSAITIVGTGFGATQGTGTAYMFIDEMTVVSWSDTKIVAIVPSQLTVGAQYNIVVKNSSGASQAFSGVTIVAATPSPTPAPAPAPTSTPTPAPTPTPSPAPAPTPTPSPAPAETLSIKSATPTLSVPGSAITIVGTGFGATQGTGTAYMFIDEMTVVSWSDTKIVAIVPSQLTVGAQYNIVVKNSSGASQAFSGVTIVAATPSPTPAPAPAPTSTPTPAPTPTPSPAPAPTPTPSPAPTPTPTPAPAPSPTPTPSPSQSGVDLTITNPIGGSTISGTTQISGTAGSEWVNLRAYSAATGGPVSANTSPVTGSYVLAVDTTQIPNGLDTIQVIAFSVPPGDPAGIPYTRTETDISVNIQNAGSISANGVCGSADGQTFSSAPSQNLCASGTTSALTSESTRWIWTCSAINIGTSSSCEANNSAGSGPMRAADFLSTLGVNVHISQGTASYSSPSLVIADMQYIGMVNMRDNYNSYWTNNYITIAKAGLKYDFITEPGLNFATSDIQSLFSDYDAVSAAAPGSIVALEGANEINNWPVTYNGVGGEQGAINLQEAIYSMTHSDPHLSGAAVYYYTGYDAVTGSPGPNPSTTRGLADFDNQHPYPIEPQPPYVWVDPSTKLDNETSTAYGPAVYTETGYNTVQSTEAEQASYTLDMLLDTATMGISRVYLYELMDEGDGWGLFDTGNNPKPAAVALHNLTTVLADTGADASTFSPVNVGFSIMNIPNPLFTLTLQKSNGATDIVIWNEPTTVPSSATAATVQLNSAAPKVNVFDSLQGTNPIQTLSNTDSITVQISDHPVIVELDAN